MLTKQQLCERLNIGTRCLDRWREQGRVPLPKTPKGCWPKWDEAEIEAWITAGMPPRHKWDKQKGDR